MLCFRARGQFPESGDAKHTLKFKRPYLEINAIYVQNYVYMYTAIEKNSMALIFMSFVGDF